MRTLNLSGLPFASRISNYNDEDLHDHDFFECFYVTDGSITHITEDGREQLTVGDAVIITPHYPHRFERTQDCTHRDNMISEPLFKACCDFLDDRVYTQLRSDRYTKFQLSPANMQIFEKNIITYLLTNDGRKWRNYERSLVIFLLDSLLYPPLKHTASLNDFQTECLAVIGDNITKYDAVDRIAKLMQLNRSYLCTKFKKQFGCTLTDYVNELKIKHAAYMLKMTHHTLPRICELIGIESLPYFIKLFKKQYGTTPAKYRKEHTEN